MCILNHIPSGKHTKNYGTSLLLMRKSTINGPFSIAMLNYQRVAVNVCPNISVPIVSSGKNREKSSFSVVKSGNS